MSRVFLLISLSCILMACGGSSSSTKIETPTFDLSGKFEGVDNLGNNAEVNVGTTTIDITLKTDGGDVVISGSILQATASTGKKNKTVSWDVDLNITNSGLDTAFVVGQTSLGKVIVEDDTKYTFAFNFTTNTARPSGESDSDWSMPGSKID